MRSRTVAGGGAVVLGILLVGAMHGRAAIQSEGTLSSPNQELQWSGGPFAASNPDGCAQPSDPTCGYFTLTLVPYTPGADVRIAIAPTSATAQTDDYDLFVYDANGQQVGSGTTSSGFERVTLIDPPAGTYTVVVQPWLVAPGSTYAGVARFFDADPPPMAAVPPPSDAPIFATPTLVDSQLHTGEPGIKVSPVVPEDGSRPLIVGDAPWGFSNATSLWWRSRDGGESYELIQDPLAIPRPRPCEEADGGGDSDAAFDPQGNIYTSDLAGLVNITVGVSADGLQSVDCSKPGGTNPLQPIQDRQWTVGAADADGPGPNIDAYLTFRRGLINGTPATETAIQIYASRDGGHTYQAVGEIGDFLGFSRSKVSQTGNPVVDWSNGPRRGTLYQAFYQNSEARVGRYNPATNEFHNLLVADRPNVVGNVFPALAIDTAGNLYYAWVERGVYDVLVSTSSDGGTTWSKPLRVNLPGGTDLAVNPYIVAGSPGRVAVLFNATEGDGTPDSANGKSWHVYVSQSLNALDASPTYTQYRVTDTPMHFNAICTGGLGCNLANPPRDRSLLEFNEVDVDFMDGSMVVIFADNGRHPLGLRANEIPQPYIMATRQIAGPSLVEGKTILNSLPRENAARDRGGDATYPKAGQPEGPNHPVMDLLGSRLVATDTGVRVEMAVADPSNLNRALDVSLGLEPRVVTKGIWVTRFEVDDKVFDVGMEHDLTGTRFWYGAPQVARNALGDAKRSNYSAADGPATAGTIACNTISAEIPYEFMGIDPATRPTFHSVVSFTLVEPAEVPEAEIYYSNQRTVDATRAYDWRLGDATGSAVIDIDDGDPAVEYRRGWHRRSDPAASGGSYHRRLGSAGGSEPPAIRLVFTGSELTYLYGVSSIGGDADVYIDGTLVGTVSHAGSGTGPQGHDPDFGRSATFGGLTPGTHELRIVHRSGAVYADGFRVRTEAFCAADPASVTAWSTTSEVAGPLGAGATLLHTFEVNAGDGVSVIVEGGSALATVTLLDPAGQVAASGSALAGVSGVFVLDAAAASSGLYTVQVADPATGTAGARLSVARTTK